MLIYQRVNIAPINMVMTGGLFMALFDSHYNSNIGNRSTFQYSHIFSYILMTIPF